MCFRPAEVAAPPVICPNCGEEVFPSSGVLPNKCPFCKESLEDAKPAEDVTPPGAPAAPAAPGATSAPAAPSAPGAPKPPVS